MLLCLLLLKSKHWLPLSHLSHSILLSFLSLRRILFGEEYFLKWFYFVCIDQKVKYFLFLYSFGRMQGLHLLIMLNVIICFWDGRLFSPRGRGGIDIVIKKSRSKLLFTNSFEIEEGKKKLEKNFWAIHLNFSRITDGKVHTNNV